MTTDLVDAYVRALRGGLRGPRRHRADLAAEVRDHLLDASAAYVDRGLTPTSAQRRAIDEFGSVDDLLPSYQATLALARTRRAALVTLVVTGLQPLIWAWWNQRPHASSTDSVAFSRMDDLMAVVGGATIALAVAALAACTVGVRHLGVRRTLLRASGVGVVVAATSVLGLAAAMVTLGAAGPTDVAFAVAAAGVPMAVAAGTGIAALHGTSRSGDLLRVR